jgi:hypothetical protein
MNAKGLVSNCHSRENGNPDTDSPTLILISASGERKEKNGFLDIFRLQGEHQIDSNFKQ